MLHHGYVPMVPFVPGMPFVQGVPVTQGGHIVLLVTGQGDTRSRGSSGGGGASSDATTSETSDRPLKRQTAGPVAPTVAEKVKKKIEDVNVQISAVVNKTNDLKRLNKLYEKLEDLTPSKPEE